jgi:F-type H+-transporting ATPase subunit gamma
MALKQIKNKIVATKKTGKVTKAMEAVSAVKMRKSQQKAFVGRPYVHSAMRILARLSESSEGLSHPLAQKRTAGKTLLVIVTSDKGLAGSVNSAVLKKAEEVFKTHSEVETICIGRKATEFAARQKKEIISSFVNVSDDIALADVYAMASQIMERFKGTQYQNVLVIYQNFISTFEQEPTMRQVLPLDPAEIQYTMQGIKPRQGKFSDNEVTPDTQITYTIEPGAEEVLNTLIPQLVQIMIYHALIESKACEHSARMVAMKNATDKSKELAKSLTLLFNKKRQAAITAEVSEITGGMEALKN